MKQPRSHKRRRRGGYRPPHPSMHGPRALDGSLSGSPGAPGEPNNLIISPNGLPQAHSQPHGPPQDSGPLSLENRCVRQFPRIALGRGRACFNAGQVSDPVWNGTDCSVQVRGTGGVYKVGLDFSQVIEARRLPVTCECIAYEKGVICKHLWAAILQVEKASAPGLIPPSETLKLVHSRPRPVRDHSTPRILQVSRATIHPVGPTSTASWVGRLNQLQGLGTALPAQKISTSSAAYFVIAASETSSTGKLVLDLWTRHRSISNDLGPLRPSRVANQSFSHFDDPRDQEVLSLLTRSGDPQVFAPYGHGSPNISSRFTVDPLFEPHLIPLLAGSGKLFLSRARNGTPDSAERPLRLDRERPWDFELKLEVAGPDDYRLEGTLKRGNETQHLTNPLAILRGGFLLFSDRVARFADPSHTSWAIALRGSSSFLIPRADIDLLMSRLLLDPAAPKLSWPADTGWLRSMIEPKPKGVFRPLGNDPTNGRMTLTVSFDYGGREVPLSEAERTLVDPSQKKVYIRNTEFEERTLIRALEILRDPQGTGTVPISDLHRAANDLCREGWTIHFENQKLRIAEDFSMNVSSSTDWFDLKLGASFGDMTIDQAELLAALESGGGIVKLADGTLGMLPPEWVAQYAPLAHLGTQFGSMTEDGNMRFTRSQGLMLNAALADDKRLSADAGFLTFREKIRGFEGVRTAKTPAGFIGKLRDYQKEGLTWLGFLEEFETGGILADDMGLGKTIQVLAFLLGRAKARKGPSLVIAPKSLTFNWIDEAAKFAPGLKVVRYSGSGRTDKLTDFASADLIVTTYGTMRTDIHKLQEFEFDVALVDEAQAIKNPKSLAAIAAKQIRARHRLALTGTPIENSIKDLLSILEFTNPGLINIAPQKEVGADLQTVLARTLKPFLLRRTKEKVLTELPDKSEQILFCEMSVTERHFYNAIRDKYRTSLTEKIDSGGMGRSKLHVLEALLRLRQASCHAGLIDPNRKAEPSAKLQLLINHVKEVTQEGHKALIFSQFTSLLALVKPLLEEEGITYEYLDGQTEDRKTPVERFQTDPKCGVFLISLKAGGTGLNLTAADYVFILDPWWNPAVEAQAIGRAHRMGQTQKVIAYRMIARGTVEEKILELQATKRELAESIISEDQSFVKQLTRQDLEMLLT